MSDTRLPLRFWLAKLFLPCGYAVWTWGADKGYGDTLVFKKEPK